MKISTYRPTRKVVAPEVTHSNYWSSVNSKDVRKQAYFFSHLKSKHYMTQILIPGEKKLKKFYQLLIQIHWTYSPYCKVKIG